MTLTLESQSFKTYPAKPEAVDFRRPKSEIKESDVTESDNTNSRSTVKDSTVQSPATQTSHDISFHDIQILASAHLPPLPAAGHNHELIKARKAAASEGRNNVTEYELFAEGKISSLYIPVEGELRYAALSNNSSRYFKDCSRRLDNLSDAFDMMLRRINQHPQHREEIVIKTVPSLIRLMHFIKGDFKVLPKVTDKADECRQNVNKTIRMLNSFKSQILTGWSPKDTMSKSRKDERFNKNLAELDIQINKTIESQLEAFARYEIKDKIVKCFNTYGPDNQVRKMSIPLQTLISMSHAKAFIFDVDDCLIDSEKHQQKAWESAIRTYTKKLTLPEDVKAELAQHATDVMRDKFSKGQMKTLCEGIHKCFMEQNALPEVMDNGQLRPMDKREFDRHLSAHRVKFMQKIAEDGTLQLLPNARRLLARLHKMQVPVGICTSSDQKVAETILAIVLDREAAKKGDGLTFDVLIPKEHRTFGDEPQVPERKPDPRIWNIAVSKIRDKNGAPVEIDQIIILDDNRDAIIKASRIMKAVEDLRKSFAAVVGLFHTPAYLHAWVKDCLGEPDVDDGVVRVLLGNLDDISLAH